MGSTLLRTSALRRTVGSRRVISASTFLRTSALRGSVLGRIVSAATAAAAFRRGGTRRVPPGRLAPAGHPASPPLAVERWYRPPNFHNNDYKVDDIDEMLREVQEIDQLCRQNIIQELERYKAIRAGRNHGFLQRYFNISIGEPKGEVQDAVNRCIELVVAFVYSGFVGYYLIPDIDKII